MFKPVSPKVDFPKLEEDILEYWKKNKIFEKSIEQRPIDKTWTFLDGPPFVTGIPHYGTLLSSLPKDLFGRYWTMKGYRVRRVWGWDGHGLPIENKVENKLEIKRKKDIEEVVGVKKFIEECRKYLNQMSAEWEWYVDHIGRWVDFKNAYKTWDLNYMESVMWVFKQMYQKEYIYKGLRVTLYCPHCETPISNFEIAMDNSYKEVPDTATTYKYKLVNELNTYILAWSTTPWNKIVTPALAVNPNLEYVKVEQNRECYVLAKSTIKTLGDKNSYKILETIKGSKLVGLSYEPHYDYYKDKIKESEKAFVVIPGDFVSAEEGTGVVTIAAYGIEDLVAMQEHNIHMEMHVADDGVIKDDVPLFGGMYYLKANKAVNDDLKARNLVYKAEEVPHSVPICWRCSTRLYYAPLDAWFVNVQKLKPIMKKTNEFVNWFPKHFKHGRFLKSLESAPDWNISRNRYWGSPVPVWECKECGERFVPGSIKELEERSGVKILDLHKPEIDEVEIICSKCGKKVKRVSEVLDSWIEAGSASFAERHFPFNTSEKLKDFYPPDYIAEYTGQIRAWFYVLHVIGSALYSSPAFKNVSVTGVIMGTDGRKMSKNFKNYPDPKEMLEKYGGDALRLYLMGSPIMHGEDILISEEQYRNQVKGMMLILWNVYNFFVTYANVDRWEVQRYEDSKIQTENVLDQWVLSRLQGTIKKVTDNLEKFDTLNAIAVLQEFIDDISLWYIRRSRERVGISARNEKDKNAFYQTCHAILVTLSKLLAPVTPFLAESIYRNLTNKESVHLDLWPVVDDKNIKNDLEKEMKYAREIVEQAHALRKNAGIKVRQPLNKCQISNVKFQMSNDVIKLIKDEINVKEIEVKRGRGALSVTLDTKLTLELKAEGQAREIVRMIQEERKKLGTRLDEQIDVVLSDWPERFEEEIKRKALVRYLTKGENFVVKKA